MYRSLLHAALMWLHYNFVPRVGVAWSVGKSSHALPGITSVYRPQVRSPYWPFGACADSTTARDGRRRSDWSNRSTCWCSVDKLPALWSRQVLKRQWGLLSPIDITTPSRACGSAGLLKWTRDQRYTREARASRKDVRQKSRERIN